MKCKRCGQEYRPSNYAKKKQMFCSRKCESQWRYEHPKYDECICKHCRKTFMPKAPERITFCSRECAFADKKVNAKGRKEYIAKEKKKAICKICGKIILTGKNEHYCSGECRKESDRRRAQDRYIPVENEVVSSNCPHCGITFETKRLGGKQYCSDSCSRKHAKRQRRARKRSQFVESVGLSYIYERDDGRCKICGKKVSLKYIAPHQLSATLDHIIPLSLGGLHEKKNIQLAHFICNSTKGIAGNDQLLLFG